MTAFIEGQRCLNCEGGVQPSRNDPLAVSCSKHCYTNIRNQQNLTCRVLRPHVPKEYQYTKPLLWEAHKLGSFSYFNGLVNRLRLDEMGLPGPQDANLFIMQGITNIVLRFPKGFDLANVPKEEAVDHKFDIAFITYGIHFYAVYPSLDHMLSDAIKYYVPLSMREYLKGIYTSMNKE